MTPAELTHTWACERCKRPVVLLVQIAGEYVCSQCWRAAGMPFHAHQESRTPERTPRK